MFGGHMAEPKGGWTPENVETMARYLAENWRPNEDGFMEPVRSEADAYEEWKATAARLGLPRKGTHSTPPEVDARVAVLREEMARAGKADGQHADLPEVAALKARLDAAEAQRDVFNSCAAKRTVDNAPCGVCRECLGAENATLKADIAALIRAHKKGDGYAGDLLWRMQRDASDHPGAALLEELRAFREANQTLQSRLAEARDERHAVEKELVQRTRERDGLKARVAALENARLKAEAQQARDAGIDEALSVIKQGQDTARGLLMDQREDTKWEVFGREVLMDRIRERKSSPVRYVPEAEAASLRAEVDALKARVAAMVRENAEAAAESLHLVSAGPATNRQGRPSFNMTFKGAEEVMCLMADAMVGYFKGTGGINYVEFKVHHPEGDFILCVQRAAGKTPHELRCDAERERDAAWNEALEKAASDCRSRAKRHLDKIEGYHEKERDDLAMEASAAGGALCDQSRFLLAMKRGAK